MDEHYQAVENLTGSEPFFSLVRQLHHLARRATDERTAVDLNALLVSWEGFMQKALGPRIALTLALDPRLRPVGAHKEQSE